MSFFKNRFFFSLFIIFVYTIFAAIAFQDFFYTFFQQDEWLILSTHTYWEKAELNWWNRLFIYHLYSHVIPLTSLVTYLHSKFFGVNFFPYAIVAITIHIFNSFLVYLLAEKLLKNKIISFIAGLFFVLNPITHQAITWVATTIGTAGSTTFLILSSIFFIDHLNASKNRLLFLCSFFLLVSLLFKETSIFSFALFPIISLLYLYKKKSNISIKKIFVHFFVFGLAYLLARSAFLIFNQSIYASSSELTQPSFIVYIYRIITAPLKFLAQSIFPVQFIVDSAKKVILLGYPNYEMFVRNGEINPFITETIASDIVSYALAFGIFLAILLVLFYRKSNLSFVRASLLSVIFICLSSLPYVLIPGRAGYFSLLDGRHLYLTSVFSVILVSIFLFSIGKLLKVNSAIFLIIVSIPILLFSISSIKNDMNRLKEMATPRKKILTQIQKDYPKLPQKVIFYADSDQEFYASGEKILPFQSGFGQTLLMWYSKYGENFPACFYDGEFLFNWTSEGYKECDGRGFGYFRKIDSLKNEIERNNFPIENIYGFHFDSDKNSLENITYMLRKNISDAN